MENITIILIPENSSFKNKKVVLVNQPILLGRALDGQDPNSSPPNWVRFVSKVVSRNHCRITHSDSKFYIQDTKSSSGTFLNGERLSPQGQESAPTELHDGDIVKLGEDYNQDNVIHVCVMFRVRLPNGKPAEDEEQTEEDNFIDIVMDNEVRATLDAQVDDEFNNIWNSLIADINMPLKKLRTGLLFQSSPPQQKDSQQTIGKGLISATSPYSTQTYNNNTTRGTNNDNSVTLIKVNTSDGNPTDITFNNNNNTNSSSSNSTNSSNNNNANGNTNQQKLQQVDPTVINDCLIFLDGLQWETNELKETVLDLAKKQDQQLLAFYKSLKGFPSSFINVASKYAKYSKSNLNNNNSSGSKK